MKRLVAIVFVSAVGLGTFAAGAQAPTLGITAPPVGSTLNTCFDPNAVNAQATADPATPYFVPGPGTITQWQLITPDDSSGEDVSFVVLKPVGADAFSVVAVDSRTIANPAPDVSSYTLAAPIAVSGGETFGLYSSDSDVLCYFDGGSTPAGDRLEALDASDPLAAGQTLDVFAESEDGFALNLAVTFDPTPTAPSNPTPPATPKKKKCKKKHKKRSAEAAKKKCKKKKKR